VTAEKLLTKVADHFEAHPETWTQGEYARDAEGSPLGDVKDPAAVCWCMEGAIHWLAPSGEIADEAFWLCMRSVPSTVFEFNDAPGRTVAEVIAQLREAAA
jgi:hypothetical protein